MGIEAIILNLLGAIFLVVWTIRAIKDFRKAENKAQFFTFKRILKGFSLILIVALPLLAINLFIPDHTGITFEDDLNRTIVFVVIATILSFLISAVWFRFVRKLDVFEQEKWIHLALVYVISCISTVVVTGIGYSLIHSLGFPQAGGNNPVYDFFYCVLVIGGVEEAAKILPILFMLLVVKKAINEPYDLILYGSVSALGFAFVENIDYIFASDLQNIGARILYSTVAHMTFTSTVCYGIMLVKFKFSKTSPWLLIPGFFLLAMLSHGFYDFWVINEFVSSLSAITTVFFLITVHLWTTMKNNALNLSNFYSPDVELNNDKLRYYLIFSLLGVMMLSYVVVSIIHGPALGNTYLTLAAISFGYMIIYLVFGLSRYRIVKDRLNPLKVPFRLFIPMPVDLSKPPPLPNVQSEPQAEPPSPPSTPPPPQP